MPENPTTPMPLDGAALLYAMAEAATAHINGLHPDLPALRWIPAVDGDVVGDLTDCYSRPPEEVAAIGAAWAQRLGLDLVDAYYAGQVCYRSPVGATPQVDITLTVDRAALRADLDARLAAGRARLAAEAGEQ